MIKKLLFFTLLTSFISTSKIIEAQGSDFQCTPTDLGLLPFATPPCSSSSGIAYSSPVTQTGTTIGATNDSLSGFLLSCYSGAPLRDVWYSFNASETHVEIQVQGLTVTPLQDSYVAIYEALTGECVGLIPRECSIGSGSGLHTMEFGPLTLGVKYYLQIASGLATGDGNFALSLKSKSICADCSKNSVLNTYPLPVNAAYPPDTTVGFCYSVIGYNGLFGNGFHGMVPLLGSGWDASTLTVYDAADSADFAGQWKWFNNLDIGSDTVSGFFYDIGGDNNPTNNLGDHGTFATIWTFCFTVRTQTAPNCAMGLNDLSIRFLNYADGESGSLVSTFDCSGDEDYVFDAHMECCPKPFGVAGLAAGCNSTPDGSIIAYAGFSIFGHDYFLYNSDGNLVATYTSPAFSTAPYTFTGLFEGNYYLYFNENTAGACMTGYNVYVPGPVIYDIQQTVFGCPSATTCSNAAEVIIESGGIASITWSNGETGLIADSLCTGWNYVTIVDTGTVACVIVDSVYIMNLPNASPFFDYGQFNYCTADSFALVTDFPAAGGGTFTMMTQPAGMTAADVDPITGVVDISGATFAGYVIIRYTSAPPCSNIFQDTLYVDVSPPAPLASLFPSQNICVGEVVSPYTNSSVYDVYWYNDTALSSNINVQLPGTTYDYFSGAPITVPGSYPFFVLNHGLTGSCKSAPLPLMITVAPYPTVDAGAPITVCPGFGVNLNLTTSGTSYLWSPSSGLSNPTASNPIVTVTSTTLYTVVVTDASGCSASDTVTVNVDPNGQCDIVYYTGFTPNGDGINDYWQIDGISIDPKNEVYIFNRWGDKIWQTVGYDNASNRWDGKTTRGRNSVPDGTYFFIIKFQDRNINGYIELTK